MAEVKLTAESRTEFGKGAARRLRRADKIPAVVYGRGTDPVHITLPGHDTMLALRVSNALLEISVDGADDVLAIPKQIQRDPITGLIEHVDMLIVKRGEKVTIDVPVYAEGEAAAETVVSVVVNTLSINVIPSAIPDSLHINVEGLEVGAQIYASEVALPEGAELNDDPETLVVNVTRQISEAELEAELESDDGEDVEVPEVGEEPGDSDDES